MTASYAVMGNPIAHSLSPFIHQQFAYQTGKKIHYEAILVAEDAFESQVRDFFIRGGKGLNITLPFKQRAFKIARIVSSRCQQAKAANTLWMQADDLYADNTDGLGLIKDLAHYLPLSDKKVLLLGAGGAARGIIAPLLAANIASLTVANRSQEKARALQADFPLISYCSFEEISLGYDLLINATSANVLSQTMPFPAIIWQTAAFYYDLAYTLDGEPPFVKYARRQGHQAMDGLGMLIEQAAESFFIWHGVRPETDGLLAKLRSRHLPRKRKV